MNIISTEKIPMGSCLVRLRSKGVGVLEAVKIVAIGLLTGKNVVMTKVKGEEHECQTLLNTEDTKYERNSVEELSVEVQLLSQDHHLNTPTPPSGESKEKKEDEGKDKKNPNAPQESEECHERMTVDDLAAELQQIQLMTSQMSPAGTATELKSLKKGEEEGSGKTPRKKGAKTEALAH